MNEHKKGLKRCDTDRIDMNVVRLIDKDGNVFKQYWVCARCSAKRPYDPYDPEEQFD